MTIIYAPTGKAREYSELAINLYTGCCHKCSYCYCPAIMRKNLEEWSKSPYPRKNILKSLTREANRATDEMKNKEVLMCFMSDPYQSDGAAILARDALLVLEKAGFKKINILTKAGFRAAKDFDILARNPGWKFGSTIIFTDEALREEWEPGAPSIESRLGAVKKAHEMGIYTWVSIEPVVDPVEALSVINRLKGHVDLWKVGKLNHNKQVEAQIDWGKFYLAAKARLEGEQVYWKKDLLKHS